MEKSDIKASERVSLIAQELEVIRMLSGNDEKAKNKALKNLNKWLLARSKSKTMPFVEEDLQRIWKGLYYCMWMSDKPLVQEECADKISKLVHFPNIFTSLLFFKAGLYILSQEWSGIQQLRLDKFLMLVRRLLRETFIAIKNTSYSKDAIERFNEVISDTILNKANKTPVGLFMHFVEIFLEELAKVSRGKLQSPLVLEFIKPFIKCLAHSNDARQLRHLKKFIFTYLIRQSKLGLEYQEKYEAWRQQGFPGHIDSMQKIKIDRNDDSSDEEIVIEKTANRKDKPLDPRAGRVDVEIPQLNFKSIDIAKAVLEYKFDANTSAQSRNMMKVIANQFTSLAKGVYPLGVKKIETNDKDDYINIRKAATSLIKYDQKISGKKTKKRKRDKENNSEEVVEKKRAKIQSSDESDSNTSNKKLKNKKNEEVVVNGEGSVKVKKSKKKNVLEETASNKSKLDENFDKKRKRKSDKIDEKTKTKNKSYVPIDEIKIKSNVIKAKNKLKNKDVQIITAGKKLRKNRERRDSNENIECIFKRNSGTWVVYDLENSENIVKSPKSSKLIKDDFSPAKSSKKQGKGDFEESKMSRLEHSSPNQSASNRFSESLLSADDSPKLGMSPVKLFESPSSPDAKEIFKKSAWDEPLQEGEYEICIPSKRHVNKLKKQAKNQNKTVHELINTTLKKIKGKSRSSLDSRLVGNPFLKSGGNNSSTKKVKINTKLNKSQEVYEHYSSVKSSPGIPFDANRRPAKPLLKPSAISTPINPFYKKQLSF
ncbi:unnamed protein product [Psylliodes chrysocephalus]|uniref:Ribosomal RNA processing protein 1 n=1 Tax=Psylliodes chrysocephalus TaxID=3402493 RepID=A0A9P0CRX7_9CUCU|nr:unnamed protein product [Psylliodes chrysocephala]